MRTKIALLLLPISIMAFSKTWVINNSGATFSPATITIQQGDSVKFELSSSHNAREVSESTWNANGTTALSGGFETPYGGGLILPAQLTVGTHWYVCVPHASIGMKGKIIVEGPTAIAENRLHTDISLFPNPFSSQTMLKSTSPLNNATIILYNSCGQEVKQIKSISGQNITLSREGLHEGLYYLRLTQNGKIVATKKLYVVDKQ